MGVNTHHKIEEYEGTNSATVVMDTIFFPTVRPAPVSDV